MNRPLRAAFPGADAPTGELMPVETALARALALVVPVARCERLALAQATGRVLAQAVTADRPLPPFDNAAMDGYALRLTDLVEPGPWTLPVAARMRAGDAPCPLPRAAACRILTGAALPLGADSVIAQEAVSREGSVIVLERRPSPGLNIRRSGDDLPAGSQIVPAGRCVGPREAAAIAAAGAAKVSVRARVRTTVLCTGSELVAPGQPLAPGQIWDANRAMLNAALDRAWIAPADLGALPDDPDRLSATLIAACQRSDLVITTGGVSVGDEDHLTRLFTDAGGRNDVLKLAMKPGKPLTIGRLGRALWLGLPGNPVAAFVAWTVIGLPLAAALAGLTPTSLPRTFVQLSAPLRHRPGRCEYRPARLAGQCAPGPAFVDCPDSPGSHRVALLAQSDGLVRIPAEVAEMRAGDLIEFLPF
ncbi:gephyrin-like molybdotransferase Glp [Pararhodobacter sp. SW119]|uniref:molybdopterin molybdotransferase MoeA n=1 Tax=Pararhodobacter sp. SW119 TaxID=2780075 RepID=UPI001AE0998B|nr:gephyrin-like molybdotransferase Glp [Pararhodobacter sp. SW119]